MAKLLNLLNLSIICIRMYFKRCVTAVWTLFSFHIVLPATSEWIQFFKEAGIPPSLAINYAVSFVDNRWVTFFLITSILKIGSSAQLNFYSPDRIQKNMLMDLSKDIMMDLGITVIGDIIAILKHAKLVYRQVRELTLPGLTLLWKGPHMLRTPSGCVNFLLSSNQLSDSSVGLQCHV